MISRELLRQVLDEKLHEVYGYDGKNNIVYIGAGADNKKINVYELAHKVKAWAYKKGWEIYSNDSNANVYKIDLEDKYFGRCDNEPEAVFKCGEYILNKI